jgi:hypothetical protein
MTLQELIDWQAEDKDDRSFSVEVRRHDDKVYLLMEK